MDRDPYIAAENDHHSAQVIQIESFGRGGVAVVLATAIIAMVLAALSYGYAGRAMDRATIAEREARIAQDKYTYLQTELAKKGIFLDTNH